MMHGRELLDAMELLPPLFGLALVAAALANLGELRKLCVGGNWLYRLGNFIIASAAAAALAVGSALCLDLVVDEPSPMLSLGVLIFTAVAGVRGLDALAYRFFGLRLVGGPKPADTSDEQGTVDEAEEHRAQMPYKMQNKPRRDKSGGKHDNKSNMRGE